MMGQQVAVDGVGNQAPPIPAPLAWTAPRKEGGCGTMNVICVGLLASAEASVCQSRRDAVTSGVSRNQDEVGLANRMCCKIENK
jgi:hypothetical protein